MRNISARQNVALDVNRGAVVYGGAQAFCQSREVDRRLVPFAVVDAFDIVEDVAAIENGRRLAKGERLHFLRRAGGHVGLFWLFLLSFFHLS